MSETIYHITSRSAWSDAQASGAYAPDSLAAEGFIHCSSMSQVSRVANAFFSGITGLVLLAINVAALRPEVRWEPGTDKPDELFPHIYGPLNLEAVSGVTDFSPDPAGKLPGGPA
jgi:uncharacterized protein (DUF952 family)